MTTISPTVRVDNAHAGSVVTLFADDHFLTSVPASDDGVTLIPAAGLGLKAGQQLTATQTATDVTGEPSRAEPVQDPPASLGAVHCASLVHECIDWLVVAGAVAGATVTVRYLGVTVGEALCDWPDWSQVSVLLNKSRSGAFKPGQVLTVWQHYVDPVTKAVISGPVTVSPPVVASPVSPPLPAPQFQRNPLQCDTEVDVSGVVPGASLRMTIDSTILDYPYVGDTIRCAVGSLKQGSKVGMYQRFYTGCGAESRTTTISADKAAPYERPTVHARVCEKTAVITVSKLRRGAQVFARAVDKHNKVVDLGLWTASQDGDDWFPLLSSAPAVLADPDMQVYVEVSNCLGQPSTSQPVGVDYSVISRDISIGPLYECGTLVEVRGTTPNALVWLTVGKTPISAPVAAISDTTVVRCYRPLVTDEVVSAVESGCGGDIVKRADWKVVKMPPLGAPAVRQPLEAWRTEVPVEGVVPGALVSVYVNGVWRGAREATSTTVRVPAGQLKASASGRPDYVHAVQQLCTATASGPAVPVAFGKMTLDTDPNPVTTGGTQSVKVIAKNADGLPVRGRVLISGNYVGDTNTPFLWTFPTGQPGPSTVVRADGYFDAPLTWHLVDPVKGTLTLMVVEKTAGITINSVSWKLVDTSTGTTVPTPAGPTVKVTLPPPPAGQEYVTYDVNCTIELTGQDNKHYTVSITGPYVGVAHIGWRGKDLTAPFNLAEASHTDPMTGATVVDYHALIYMEPPNP
ncbi:hypothetical protein ACQPZZ_09035 [Microbispora sp. CA-135349]|uniref:hypothetical protein n=1 Tax=Microbispora sp. CA-135349 TaxID=3239953 RepID=UPI003D89D4D4